MLEASLHICVVNLIEWMSAATVAGPTTDNSEVQFGEGIFIEFISGHNVFCMLMEDVEEIIDEIREYCEKSIVAFSAVKVPSGLFLCFGLYHLSVAIHCRKDAEMPRLLSFLRWIFEYSHRYCPTTLDTISTIRDWFDISLPDAEIANFISWNWRVHTLLQKISSKENVSKMMRNDIKTWSGKSMSADDLASLLVMPTMLYFIESKFMGTAEDQKQLQLLKDVNMEFQSDCLIKVGHLGMGSYGTVSTVLDTRSLLIFAMKESVNKSPDHIAKIRNEYEIMRKFDHDGIVHVFGCVDNDGIPAIIMECGIQRLATYLPLFDGEYAVPFILDLVFAVDLMHAMGYVHRDIKLANVVIGYDECAKLCDFGSACPFREANIGIDNNVTMDNMAPETRRDGIFTIFSDVHMLLNLCGELSSDIDAVKTRITEGNYESSEMFTSTIISWLIKYECLYTYHTLVKMIRYLNRRDLCECRYDYQEHHIDWEQAIMSYASEVLIYENFDSIIDSMRKDIPSDVLLCQQMHHFLLRAADNRKCDEVIARSGMVNVLKEIVDTGLYTDAIYDPVSVISYLARIHRKGYIVEKDTAYAERILLNGIEHGYSDLFTDLAYLYKQLGRFDQAQQCLSRAPKSMRTDILGFKLFLRNPRGTPDPYKLLGSLAENLGCDDNAAELCSSVLSIVTKHLIWSDMGECTYAMLMDLVSRLAETRRDCNVCDTVDWRISWAIFNSACVNRCDDLDDEDNFLLTIRDFSLCLDEVKERLFHSGVSRSLARISKLVKRITSLLAAADDDD